MQVPVAQLSSVCLTRRRGAEAYERLRHYLSAEDVEIHLEGVEILSASFLDEIVSRLLRSGEVGKVTFVTDEPANVEKLGRIAGTHNVALRVRSEKDVTARFVTPRRVKTEFTYTGKKAPAAQECDGGEE